MLAFARLLGKKGRKGASGGGDPAQNTAKWEESSRPHLVEGGKKKWKPKNGKKSDSSEKEFLPIQGRKIMKGGRKNTILFPGAQYSSYRRKPQGRPGTPEIAPDRGGGGSFWGKEKKNSRSIAPPDHGRREKYIALQSQGERKRYERGGEYSFPQIASQIKESLITPLYIR